MTAETNRAVARRYFDEFHNQRRREIGAEIIAEALRGPTEAATDAMTAAFPDYRIEIASQLAEGDLVATVWWGEGTHEGEWASPIGPIPPSHASVRFSATTTLRIADGKIAEVIGSNWDHLGILQQMGAVTSAAPRPGA